MNVKIISSILIFVIVGTIVGCGIKNKIEHYGEAIITKEQREAPENIYTDSGVVKTSEYKGMTKKVEVYGLTLYASDNISDEFMIKISKIFKEMFPKLEGEDLKKQEEVLKNLYKYKACLPVVKENEIANINTKLINDYSVCDIIMKVDRGQVMEVVEHLLHAVTDVGLSYSFPNEWGFENNSKIKKSMQNAIENKYYDVSSYNMKDEEVRNRILIQEYAYWLISSKWNLQEIYGPNEKEWTLNNSEKVIKNLPEADKLMVETTGKIMISPKEETLITLN